MELVTAEKSQKATLGQKTFQHQRYFMKKVDTPARWLNVVHEKIDLKWKRRQRGNPFGRQHRKFSFQKVFALFFFLNLSILSFYDCRTRFHRSSNLFSCVIINVKYTLILTLPSFIMVFRYQRNCQDFFLSVIFLNKPDNFQKKILTIFYIRSPVAPKCSSLQSLYSTTELKFSFN